MKTDLKQIFESLKEKKQIEQKRMFSEEKIKKSKESQSFKKQFFNKNKHKKGNFLKKKTNEQEIIEDNDKPNYFDT